MAATETEDGSSAAVDESGGGAGATEGLTVDQALGLAFGLQKEGFLPAAEEIYRRLLQAFPDHVDALHFLGIACHQQGRTDEGLALLRRALALAPGHAGAWNNLGNILAKRGDLADAEDAYRRALRDRPNQAEAHTNLGTVLRRKGDLTGAEACFRAALAIDPNHGEAYHQLGSALQETDRPDEALTCFQRSLTLRPYDAESYRWVGATLYALDRIDEAHQIYARWLEVEPKSPLAAHLLAATSGGAVPARASDSFVTTTFDLFAESFDRVLERLEYRAPALVADALGSLVGAPTASLDVLDAGAGTGLCGPLLRPFARRLVGADLSSKMLELADKRGVYDALDTAELTAYLRARPAAFDAIVSADTLVYFGDLAAVLEAATHALRPGGFLVFTVEHAVDEPDAGYRLNPHGRYSHSEPYLRRVLTAVGLAPLSMVKEHLRSENRAPVDGLVVSARATAAGVGASGTETRRKASDEASENRVSR